MSRHFLFLQGMATPFFSRLADTMIAHGERVSRVNFCAGDALYWRGKPAWHYRGEPAGVGAYLAAKCDAHRITDFVLFCDQFPVHRTAVELAARKDIRVHVFEEGYVRPHWITLQRGGLHAAYVLPRDPRWYLEVNARLQDPGEGNPLHVSYRRRAVHDFAYHVAGLVNPLAYPAYRTHRPFVAPVEYAGWAQRYAHLPYWRPRDRRNIRRLTASGARYFFFPLQLNADVQVARHSPFGTTQNAIEHVLASFAAHAPADTLLAVKNHPFDTGLARFERFLYRRARELGIGQRIRYFETGDANTLIDHSQGVVTVNSTVGMSALQRGKPTKSLGRAVYDLPGLADQIALDQFWKAPRVPDSALCRAFRNVIVHATQINGGFYTGEGIALALRSWRRLLEPQSRLEALLAAHPPAEADAGERVLAAQAA